MEFKWLLSLSIFWLLATVARTATDMNFATLQNDYVFLRYDKRINAIVFLAGDFHGTRNFSKNVLATALKLEIIGLSKDLENEKRIQITEFKGPVRGEKGHFLKAKIFFTLENVAIFSQELSISIQENFRSIEILSKIVLINSLNNISALTCSIYSPSPSLTALYSTGVVQMMNKPHACFGSSEKLERIFFVGDGSALDVLFSATNYETVLISSLNSKPTQSGIQFVLAGKAPYNVRSLEEGWKETCWNDPKHRNILSLRKSDTFLFNMTLIPNNYDFPAFPVVDVQQTSDNLRFIDLQTSLMGIYASAVGCLETYYSGSHGIIAATVARPDVGYSPSSNFFDPDSFLTISALLYSGEVYLVRQVKEVLWRTGQTICGIGQATDRGFCKAMKQHHPRNPPSNLRGAPMVVFSFEHFQCMQNLSHPLYQSKLLRKNSHLRRLLSVSPKNSNAKTVSTAPVSWSPLASLYEPKSRSGMIMHHFVRGFPTYQSIALSEQLGPNIFWTLSVWRYISVSEDHDFALGIFPFVDLSCKFIFSFLDAERMLLNTPGPLWIDVIVREFYTSDSNAMIVEFIDRMSDYCHLLHRSTPLFTSLLTELQQVKTKIVEAYNQQLWISEVLKKPGNRLLPNSLQGAAAAAPNSPRDSQDHYVTQVFPDFTTFRDFVDYDANLMAIAFRLLQDPVKIAAVLKRIDSGEFSHVKPTYCSELPYYAVRSDCYLTLKGDKICGDSIVSFGRIAYIDALARKTIGDRSRYESLILRPLQRELIDKVWLSERFDQQGQMVRTSHFFEYPSVVAMLVREVSYGIDLRMTELIIHPLVERDFVYNVGNGLLVEYRPLSRGRVRLLRRALLDSSDQRNRTNRSLQSSSSSERRLELHGLEKSRLYHIHSSCTQNRVKSQVRSDERGVLVSVVSLLENCPVSIAREKEI